MDSSGIYLSLAGVGILLIWSAFFSGSETALMAIRRARLHEMEKNGGKGIARVKYLIDHPETLLSTILLGNNLVNIGASALTTGLFIQLFGEIGVVYATLAMTFLVLVFAEVLPKTIANLFPERISLFISPLMSLLVIILRPATYVVRAISRGAMRLLGISAGSTTAFSEHDVRGAIGLGHQHGVLEDDEHRMLDSILDLEALTVEDIMIHRSSVTSIDITTKLEDISTALMATPHSRIPVWQDEPDNIVGILHVKDYFHAWHLAEKHGNQLKIDTILQEPYFVPETTNISQQLFEFRRLRRHLALVVDEYGDLQGLVTLEDILEEIVGEIEDEHDIISQDIQQHDDGTITLPGVFPVRDANRDLDWNLPEDEDAVTVGGLMMDTLGHIPAVGESVDIAGLTLKVKTKKRQAITSVLVTPIPEEESTD